MKSLENKSNSHKSLQIACFNGLGTVNVELTNRCNKKCWMCGRRKAEKENPGKVLYDRDMDFALVVHIASQLPKDIVIQFHNNGEPLLYPQLSHALDLFQGRIRCLDTNGKLLVERAPDIIGRLDTLTVSTFERDEEWEEQYKALLEFLRIKGKNAPRVIIRCLGDLGAERLSRYEKTGCLLVPRVLHSPMGSYQYTKNTVIPEVGFCIELMSHMAIDHSGDVSICVRFDPERHGVIGNINNNALADIWNSEKRRNYIRQHVEGKRNELPLCGKCHYWGVPRG